MKQKTIFLLFALFCAYSLFGAWIDNIAGQITQPDGKVIDILFSGDEFFVRAHDQKGFTIIQDENTGFWCWASRTLDIDGKLQSSGFPIHLHTPESLSLTPGISISRDYYLQLREPFDRDRAELRSPSTGVVNNIIVFIRFSDQAEFTTPYSTYYDIHNQMGVNYNSMRRYFWDASYQQLDVYSPIFPLPSGNVIVSYQSTHPRNYFQPHNAITNPTGYTGGSNGTERRMREHSLLRDAIEAVRTQIPSDMIIDADNDGNVDNVSFIIRGSSDGWSELLWPHMWVLHTHDVRIHGKRVWAYNFNIENHLGVSGVGVLAHEFAHSMGLPDLYRYNNSGTPIGNWDLMASDLNPPQSISAYMKARYTNWVPNIPVITQAGVYTLQPITTSSTNHAVRINSPNSSTEYFVVEYRSTATEILTDQNLPGSGLLIYRVNTLASGNAQGVPDELYVYRPGGNNTGNGTINNAFYSLSSGRTAINSTTNPTPFLSNNAAGGLNITNIGNAGATISFTVNMNSSAQNLTASVNGSNVTLNWEAPTISTGLTSYRVFRGSTLLTTAGISTFSYTDSGLAEGIYTYRVIAVYGAAESQPVIATASVGLLTYQLGSGDIAHTNIQSGPINIYYRSVRGQFVYTVAELNAIGLIGAQEIKRIAFYVTDAPQYPLPNFNIRIKHTNAGSVTFHDGGPFTSTTVFPSLSPEAGDWFVMTLAQPFMWNGTQNILFDTAFGLTSSWNSSGVVRVIPAASGYGYTADDNTSMINGTVTAAFNFKPQVRLYTAMPAAYPVFSINLSNYNFGNTNVGQLSYIGSFIITNNGTAPLIVSSITKTGAYSEEFDLPHLTGLPWTIAVGDTRAFVAQFAPTSLGYKNIHLNIVHNAANSPYTVSLSGTGVQGEFSIDPISCDFDETLVGEVSAEQLFTITNTGLGSLVINSITMVGDDYTQFTLPEDLDLPWSIVASDSRSFSTTFNPSSVGVKSATIVINDNVIVSDINRTERNVRETHNIPLTGIGVTPAIFSISPTSRDFGNCLIDEVSPEQTFTITNTGGSGLWISSIDLTEDTENQFSLDIENNISVNIAPSDMFTFTATFNPTTIGEKSANITITHSADETPVNVALTGMCIRPQTIHITPTSYNFEKTNIGDITMPFAFTITNTGDLPLVVSDIELSGADSEHFDLTIQSEFPETITDDSMTFLVSFQPSTSGTKSANIVVTNNAAGSPHIVEVTGEASTSDSDNVVVHRTALFSNYPNPFNPETNMRFFVDGEQKVTIDIYNFKGQRVKQLVSGSFSSGEHSIVWDGRDETGNAVSSGVYFYRMVSEEYSSVRKMILLK